jgi:alpha-ketoglutarate-dependent 2,4-dichlorophenoxyacetate dioxygenase
MTIAIERVHPKFGARITGLDLRHPLDDVTFKAIDEAFNEYSVLVFPGQPLTDAQQIEFSRRFGALEETISSIANKPNLDRKIADLSNVDADGHVIDPADKRMVYHSANQMWHTDSSFKRVPALASMLSGRECPPEGGETEFASMRVAYERLPESTRRSLEGKIAVHSFAYSRGLGRTSIFVASHASHIVGMPCSIADVRGMERSTAA